jgi:hypothetical protein
MVPPIGGQYQIPVQYCHWTRGEPECCRKPLEATAVSATLPRPCVDPNDGGLSHESVGLVAGVGSTRDERRMSSIIRAWGTYHGISVESRGVFKDKNGTLTYAGQIRDGYACGLGLATWPDGAKVYAEYGPDGQFDGRRLARWADGDTEYRLYERGGQKADATVYADGTCKYNGEDCAPDDPRLLALIAQVAPVEVRPAAPAPYPPSARHSPPSNRPMDQPARFSSRRRSRRPWPPRCIPTPHAVAGGRAKHAKN